MPPLPARHLLPHILQILPRNPKYDQFHWKGHRYKENPESITKMTGKPHIWPVSLRHNSANSRKISNQDPKVIKIHQHAKYQGISTMVLQEMSGNLKFDPVFLVKIEPKLQKSTNHNHNLVSTECGQQTSACNILGHSLHAFSEKCLETPNLTHFIKSK